MVCKAKTFSAAGGAYEAPRCKVYSITTESRILTESNVGNPGEAGAPVGDDPYGEF